MNLDRFDAASPSMMGMLRDFTSNLTLDYKLSIVNKIYIYITIGIPYYTPVMGYKLRSGMHLQDDLRPFCMLSSLPREDPLAVIV